jgi:hypothetical protein
MKNICFKMKSMLEENLVAIIFNEYFSTLESS